MTEQRTGRNRYWGKLTPPKSKAEFFDAITVPSGEGNVATIRLYGPIDSFGGWWGISASDVSDVLDSLPDSVTQIILRINSPGGEVFEAMSILNMLRAHKATVTGVVDGLAASAGSVIAVGCDETVMSPGTTMMIHSPSSIAWGNAAEMRKTADVLDGIEESIISIYRDKAGESAWGELLSAETWYTAQQAVESGLADRVGVVKDAGETSTAGAEEEDPLLVVVPLDGDDVEDMYEAARAHLGLRPIGASASPKPPSSPEPGNTTETEKLTMSDTFLAEVRNRLGVTDANASEETVLAAFDEHLAEQADIPAAPAASIPDGAIVVDKAAYEQLVGNAAAGRQAMDSIDAQRRDGIISDALKDGRIAAANKDSWRAQLDKDEDGIKSILDGMLKNTAVPVTEVGHSDTLTSVDDSLYAGAGWGSNEKEA